MSRETWFLQTGDRDGASMTKFGVLTLSFNKPGYVADAISSVLAQTFKDFLYVVVDNSTADKVAVMQRINCFNDRRMVVVEEEIWDEERKRSPMNTVLFDQYLSYLKDKVELILFLADDDELMPECLEEIVKFFGENPDKMVCYHWVQCIDMAVTPPGFLGAMCEQRVFYKGVSPDCAIDGGSFTIHSSCLDRLPYPYCGAPLSHAFHGDGIFMAKITQHFPAYPLQKFLSRKRWTRVSCFGSRR